MNLFTKQKQTQTLKTNVWSPKGKWVGNKLVVWDQQMQTAVYKIDKQQGPAVQRRELQSTSCDKP